MKRIETIDYIRGLVMIVMALDHTRDFLHIASAQSPTNLATTTPLLFLTRWITHLCAPTFVFLSGVSVYLSLKKQNDIAESRRFLLSRGIWLIFLEFTVVNFALWWDVQFRTLIFEVIGAIGFGFIVLSFLLKIAPRSLGIVGLIIIFGHDLVPLLPLSDGSAAKLILSALFGFSVTPLSPQTIFILAYPPIPWLGIMLFGFSAGTWFEMSAERRNSIFLKMSIAALTLFVAIRLTNFYGDPAHWSPQSTPVFTVISFFNTTKYPVSLLFTLMTLGIIFLKFAFVQVVPQAIVRVVTVFGRVPLFYFVVHLYILHVFMFVILFLQGFQWSDFVFGSFSQGRPKAESGVSLGMVYLIWLGVVVLMYPLCRWFGAYKAAHQAKKKWLRYL